MKKSSVHDSMYNMLFMLKNGLIYVDRYLYTLYCGGIWKLILETEQNSCLWRQVLSAGKKEGGKLGFSLDIHSCFLNFAQFTH